MMNTLPALAPTACSSGAPSPSPRRATLLIVDDEEGPRQSLRVIFKDDYNILMASDGPSAIELARRHRIDVALLDVRMAGMSGIEVLERLKYVDPGIEVVMITAFETPQTMRQALRLRASDYINKPFDISTIRAAVTEGMRRRSLGWDDSNQAEKLQSLLHELQNQKIEEQMSQTRGEIYASIIHDINSPLTVISGFVQLMNQRIGNATRLEQDDVQFIKERLTTITRQVTNCIEISRRYLSFLRRGTDDTPQVGINQLLSDLGSLLRVHPSLRNHQFEIEPLASDIAPRMNGTDVIQVLLNLAVNAFQCSPIPQTVRIRAWTLAERPDLGAVEDGPQDRVLNLGGFSNAPPLLALAVSDTGPGIPPDILPRVFEPYFTTKKPRQGTGLGLNIVQRLVKEACGALHVHTRAGSGTTFTIYLPAAPLGCG